MKPASILALALAAATLAAGGAHAQGDAAKGKAVFDAVCSGCHAISGPSFAAPPLGGVVGRAAGTAPAYSGYTKALKSSGITWTDATLDAFLADPGKLVAGTAMPINVPSAADRADVIAYLKTLAGQ